MYFRCRMLNLAWFYPVNTSDAHSEGYGCFITLDSFCLLHFHVYPLTYPSKSNLFIIKALPCIFIVQKKFMVLWEYFEFSSLHCCPIAFEQCFKCLRSSYMTSKCHPKPLIYCFFFSHCGWLDSAGMGRLTIVNINFSLARGWAHPPAWQVIMTHLY